MDECTAEGVARAEAINNVDVPGLDPHALISGLSEGPFGSLLHDRETNPALKESVGCPLGIGDAHGHLTLFAVADGDVDAGQDGCDTRARLGHAAPQIGPIVEVEDCQAARRATVVESTQVQIKGGAARQAGDSEPEDFGTLDGAPIDLILPQLQVWRTRLTIEVEREGVGREKLREGDGGMEVADGNDMIRRNPEVLQLTGNETTEGIVPHPGDNTGAMPESRCCNCDVRRAAAEELAEGLDIFEVHANLERIDIDAGTTHRQNVDIATFKGHGDSFPLHWGGPLA